MATMDFYIWKWPLTRPKLTVYVLTGDINVKKQFPKLSQFEYVCVCQLMEAGAGGVAGVGV